MERLGVGIWSMTYMDNTTGMRRDSAMDCAKVCLTAKSLE